MDCCVLLTHTAPAQPRCVPGLEPLLIFFLLLLLLLLLFLLLLLLFLCSSKSCSLLNAATVIQTDSAR